MLCLVCGKVGLILGGSKNVERMKTSVAQQVAVGDALMLLSLASQLLRGMVLYTRQEGLASCSCHSLDDMAGETGVSQRTYGGLQGTIEAYRGPFWHLGTYLAVRRPLSMV